MERHQAEMEMKGMEMKITEVITHLDFLVPLNQHSSKGLGE